MTVLSVLVPFYRDDPTDTLRSVAELAGPGVEIVAWDDGTGDAELTARVEALVGEFSALRLVTAARNAGRAAARNGLVRAARGKWLLFLDADMRPLRDDFLRRYLDAVACGESDIMFGGFVVRDTGPRGTELHRELSRRSDCRSAEWRRQHGPQHVASSNLLVRRDVLEAEGFDSGFEGWGWEDSEWAARVSKRFRLAHLDNPAVHLGLESNATVLERFATSGANYARFTRAHPELAERLALHRAASRLAAVPGQALARPVLRYAALAPLPMSVRVLALKLWRASHYADYLKAPELKEAPA